MNDFFDEIFNELGLNEGGYANNPDDTGKETYLGVTFRDHPNAKFWATLHAIKAKFGVNAIDSKMKAIPEVLAEIKDIYKSQYWNPIHLSELNSKQLCYQLFDHAVNAGVGSAISLAYELVKLPKSTKFTNQLLVLLQAYGSRN